MDPLDDEKQAEAITTVEVVPDLGEQVSTTAERIGAYFTIATAAAGLISDGCGSPRTTVSNSRID